jgi:superfamily I DNA and RNA helicase
MELRIGSPELGSDEITREFIAKLQDFSLSLNVSEPVFYYKYPIFRDESNVLYRSKALLATRSHGVFVFGVLTGVAIVDAADVFSIDNELTQLDTILYGKFLRSKLLRQTKRDLAFNVSVGIYCPEKISKVELDNELLTTPAQIRQLIEAGKGDPLSDEQWEELLSLLDGGKGIARPDVRDSSLYEEGTRAYALAEVDKKITNFDRFQRSAALSTPTGPQRIRGIAGSGKTIVLAKKAAQLHLEFPEKEILITFWTKSLYELLRQQITRFYRQNSDSDPDWTKLNVFHAWGGRNNPGVYYNACLSNGRQPLTFKEIVSTPDKSKFAYACSDLLRFSPLQQDYDYILIDEGQDLPPAFYELCFDICRGGEKDRNIIWAYDELQTIMETRVQDVHTTFGYIEDTSVPRMDLERAYKNLSHELIPHDIVLKRCYRNPAEILVVAHALGFGIYGPQFVQMLENRDHWEDLGYQIVEGNCKPGEKTIISRVKANSPLDLDDYIDSGDIVRTFLADGFKSEVDNVCQEIGEFIESGLKPQDILIISLDDLNARNYFSAIARRLDGDDLSLNNIQDSKYSIPEFFIDGKITASTVYKAKGNEAPVVFVVGVDAIADQLNDIRARNKLFTAFTRSRGWLRVSGLAPSAQPLINEVKAALGNFPNLSFVYPDPKKVWTIQRDMSELQNKIRELKEKMMELELNDVDPEEIARMLKKIPNKTEKK